MKFFLFLFLSLTTPFLAMLAQAQERPGEKAFKGMELYSWKNSSGDWVFALLPGTNRLKTEMEIKRKENQISNTTELAKSLSRLAADEQVFWFHRDFNGFSYPNASIIDEIFSSAKKAKVQLHVPPEDEQKFRFRSEVQPNDIQMKRTSGGSR